SAQIKAAEGADRSAIQAEIDSLKRKPAELKDRIQGLDAELAALEPELRALLLTVPLPPDADVPVGTSSDDNVELRRWNPPEFDPSKTFEQNKGFRPRTHIELGERLGLVDFERGVKMAGSRSYVLTGLGMRLHQAA